MVDQKKEDFMSHIEHYRAVLDDLQRQRDLHQLKMGEIDRAIAALHHLIPEDAKEALPTPNYSNVPTTCVVNAGKYAGMSVRWAILNLLSEDATGPMSTGEIADALRHGGITSAGRNFSANVSAVLSDMNNKRGEVISRNDGWGISPSGKQAWAHISAKRSAQFPMLSSSVQ